MKKQRLRQRAEFTCLIVAEVKAVGGDVKNVKVGDRIVYKEYSTTDLKIDGTEYLVVREEDILATVVG